MVEAGWSYRAPLVVDSRALRFLGVKPVGYVGEAPKEASKARSGFVSAVGARCYEVAIGQAL
jgi:hypothetical protein